MATRSLGTLTLDLVAKVGGFTGPIDRASRVSEKQFRQMERDAKRAAQGFAVAGAAATAAAGAIYSYSKSGMDSIDAQAKLARQLDSTIGGLRGLQMAANDAGVETGVINSAMERFSARLGEALRGSGQAKDALDRLGLSANQLATMDVDQRVAVIADRVKELGLSGAETADVLRQFGIRNREIVNLLRQGGGAIRDARVEIEGFGLAVNDVDAAAIEEANDSIARLGLASEALQTTVAINLTPALNSMADELYDITKAFKAGDYDTQIRALQGAATAASTVAAMYGAYRAALGAATIAQWAFNAAVRANPVGLIATSAAVAVTGLGALGAALDDSAEKAARMEGRANELAASLQHMGETSIRTQLAAITLELSKMDGAAEALAESNRKRSRDNSLLGGIDSMRQSIELTARANATSSEEAEKLRTQQLALQQALDLVTDSARPTAQGITEISVASSDATKDAEALEQAYLSLIDKLYPLEAEQRRFREEMELLDLAAAAGDIDNLTEAQQRLRDSFKSGESFEGAPGMFNAVEGDEEGYWDKWLEGAEVALSSFDVLAGDVLENFSSSFGNAFESMIFDAESLGDAVYDLADGMARSIVNALGEMAAQWLAYQAVQMLVGKTTQSAAASTMITNAMASQQMAGLNAFASTAAIPIVGPVMAPAAMATALAATTPAVSAISSLAVAGMAHEGIDTIPTEGTWLLDKGERVLTNPQANKLDQFLAQQQGGGASGGDVTVNLIESPEGGGEVTQQRNEDGTQTINIVVSQISQGNNRMSKAFENAYGLTRRGS